MATVGIGRVLIGPPEMRGRGNGRKLMAALLRLGYGSMGLHRMELDVYDFNSAAIRCYGSLGFRREGIRRQCVRVDNEYWNSIWMSILRHEWNDHSLGDARP